MSNSFVDGILSGSNKRALPIITYPALQFTGSSILETLTNAEKLAELSIEAAKRTDCAAAMCVMDLSVEAEAFGAELSFEENSVPAVSGCLVESFDDAKALAVPDVRAKRCGIFIDSVTLAKQKITDRPLFAGVCAPFSLCARLMGVTECMMCMFDEPETVHTVLAKCTEFLMNYVKALKDAGADGVLLAEPVAGLLSPDFESEFSAPYTKKLAETVKDDGFTVIYHNCGSVERMTDSIFANGCDCYHFGDGADMRALLEAAPAGKLVMGNISPLDCFVNGTPETMRAKVSELLAECKDFPNFVLSSGCDIPANAKWENIEAFFAAAKER